MTRITLHLPDRLYRRFRETAAEAGKSVNAIIVAELTRAIGHNGGENPWHAEELESIRWALNDMLVEIDMRQLSPSLCPPNDLPGTDTLRESLPDFFPALSATIIDGREDRV